MILIDADEYIKKLRYRIGIEPTWNLSGLRIAIFELHSMPTIDPVRWIPVSELPEKNGEYLVTKIDHITSERLTDIAYYDDFICTNNGFHKADDVVAWMPLPEPWRGKEDE